MTSASDANSDDAIARLLSGDTWQRLTKMLSSVEPTTRGHHMAQDDLARGEAARFLLRVLETARLGHVELDDPAYPQLKRLYDSYLNYGDCNPDCIYQHAAVSDQYSYRISGTRGSARILDVQCMLGGNIDARHRGAAFLSEIEGKDGEVEIILSAQPHEGNWVRIDSGVTWIYVRQYSYDWNTEKAADLRIERIGATYPPPPVSAAPIARSIEHLIAELPAWITHVIDDIIGRHHKVPMDELFWMLSKSAMAENHYGNGRFELEPGQAMVVELKEPRASYWNVVALNAYGESTRWDVRQTSLNGAQAQVDPDGVIRFVISPTDPGVPNWLDTEGRLRGIYTIRVLRPEADPEVKIRIVPLADVRSIVHPATAVVSAAERSDLLQQRMRSSWLRFRQ